MISTYIHFFTKTIFFFYWLMKSKMVNVLIILITI